MELLSQGAEAKVYKIDYLDTKAILKQRFKKGYRLEELDKKITNKRTSQEARTMHRCLQLNISCPTLYEVNPDDSNIIMEYIDGWSIKETILKLSSSNEYKPFLKELMYKIGILLFKLHKFNIIHGDLTTSNLILKKEGDKDLLNQNIINNKIYLIDFGLSYLETKVEDKAVDLYVLERAFISTHPDVQYLFENILTAYSKPSNNEEDNKLAKVILNRLDEVRLRGRKRSMVG